MKINDLKVDVRKVGKKNWSLAILLDLSIDGLRQVVIGSKIIDTDLDRINPVSFNRLTQAKLKLIGAYYDAK